MASLQFKSNPVLTGGAESVERQHNHDADTRGPSVPESRGEASARSVPEDQRGGAGLVSVVLPNRNHAGLIVRQVSSLLVQTHGHLEILIVDDASTDDSRRVIERLAGEDSRVRPLFLPHHRGLNAAIQAGLEAVGGPFLHLAAADDWVEPDFLSQSVAMLERHPWTGLCFSDPTTVDERGGVRRLPLFLADAPAAFAPDDLVALFARRPFHMTANSVVYRREQFDRVGGLRPPLEQLADWYVNTAIALTHGAVYLPEHLTTLFVRPDSYSAVTTADPANQRRALASFVRLLDEPDQAPLRDRFRSARLLPEYRWRAIGWLQREPGGRDWLSRPMIARLLLRGLWHYVRPVSPRVLREAYRRRLRAVPPASDHGGAPEATT